MGALLQLAASFFAGDAGAKIGAGVANATALAGILAALAGPALWLHGHKEDIFISLTYGDLAFWGSTFGLFVLTVVKVAHYARSPGS